MAIITRSFPATDDPIFDAAFVVGFPVRGKRSTAAAKQTEQPQPEPMPSPEQQRPKPKTTRTPGPSGS